MCQIILFYGRAPETGWRGYTKGVIKRGLEDPPPESDNRLEIHHNANEGAAETDIRVEITNIVNL